MKKSNKIRKILSSVMTFILAATLTACGAKAKLIKRPVEQMKGNVDITPMDRAFPQTWDVCDIYIPEAFDFYGGTEENDSDIHFFSLKLIEDENSYFNFEVETDRKLIMDQYEADYEKYDNNQYDISETFGDIKWKGFQYENEQGEVCFEVHAKKYDRYLLVKSRNFDFYSPASEGILSHLVVEEVDYDTMPDPE